MIKIIIIFLGLVLNSVAFAEKIKFSVSSLDYSKFYTEKSFKGKIAIFSFIDVHCPHCQQEMKTMFGDYKDLSSQNFEIRFISLSSFEDTEAFLNKKKYDAKYFGIINKNAEISRLLQAIGNNKKTVPFSLILNSNGTICKQTWNLLNKKNIIEILKNCK